MPEQPLNLHTTAISEGLPSPEELRRGFPASARGLAGVAAARDALERILAGDDDRLIVIAGPCSIHDPLSARHYAEELAGLADGFRDDLVVLMRAYFEKPRTCLGWKGFLHDPDLDGRSDMLAGLRGARALLVAIADLGLGIASEILDPLSAGYLTDLLSWVAVGARTSESQVHRELASGLPMPVGFKNGTGGDVLGALCAVAAARAPHTRMAIGADGRIALERTRGNPMGHLVLRGGRGGPNYGPEHIRAAVAAAEQAGVNPRLVVDCSHENSQKRPERQPAVVAEVADQVAAGNTRLVGVMLESHLVAGSQALAPGRALTYGQSITDGCIDLRQTRACLERLRGAVRRRRVVTGRA